MVSSHLRTAIVACTALTMLSVAYAGAGARVQACLYLATAPVGDPLVVQLTAGGSADQCLNDKGHDASLKVTDAGVSCVDVGYVEGKDSDTGSDNCAAKDSIWTLGYNSASTGNSGSTSSTWTSGWLTDNKCELRNPPKYVTLCGQAQLCNDTTIRWSHTLGPLYFIFNPSAAGTLEEIEEAASRDLDGFHGGL